MFFSKITFKKGPELFNLLKQDSHNNGYIAHQILWSLFPNDGNRKRDFLFYKNDKSEMPQFYVVSKKVPIAKDGVIVETKPYDPKLKKSQKLCFSLMANPVVSRKEEGKKNSIKHDVWMDTKKKSKEMNLDKPAIVEMCENASKEWLISQGERCGFSIDINDLVIDGYIQNRLFKKQSKKPICFSSIHYTGFLTVTDSEKFKLMLSEGIGRSKAFGCGLMLVRKI